MVNLKSVAVTPPTLFFFFKIVSAILGSVPLHVYVRINLSVVPKNVLLIFWGIVLNLEIKMEVGRDWRLYYVESSEPWILCFSLHLFRYSFISFIRIFKVLVCKLCGYFVILQNFIFWAIVNGIEFLISASTCSIIVYRNKTDFHMLILYRVTLLKSLSSCRSCLADSLGFSLYIILSFANRDSINSSF